MLRTYGQSTDFIEKISDGCVLVKIFTNKMIRYIIKITH